MTNQIEYRKGDMFSHVPGYNTILAHGVNCQGVMGSGVAKTFKQKYPHAFQDYVKFICDNEYEGKTTLGDVCFSTSKVEFSDGDLILASMFTQEFYGRDNKVYISYEAFFKSFRLVADFYEESTIVMPKIGAGLGGGDWKIIECLMIAVLQFRPKVNVIVYEL
jgi:O-acetyl-ADP-ribose deacetylase (regulator of RNase III)